MLVKEEKKIKAFFNEYGNFYSDKDLRIIKQYMRYNTDFQPSIGEINQIYSYLGLFSTEDDIYVQFIDMLEKKFNFILKKNILEIGCGFFPTLAYHISRKQMKIGAGTITAYDPKLILSDFENIKLFRDFYPFDKTTEAYDIIVSMMPCDTTIDIIKNAYEYNKEFLIATCTCVQAPYEQEEWMGIIKDFVEKNKPNNCELFYLNFPNSKVYTCPVIGCKKKV